MKERIERLRAFLDAAHSVYHANAIVKTLLEKDGYLPLVERQDWNIQPGGKYYVSRGGTERQPL